MSAELGVVLVGSRAASLAGVLPRTLPRIVVADDLILPLPEDLQAMAALAAENTFMGADADRWRHLAPRELEDASVLWASAQVQGAHLATATGGWDKVLVVGWVDEPALTPAIRAVIDRGRPVSVLLGGEEPTVDRARAQAARVVLAELVRANQLTTVLFNPVPGDVLDVALDAARSPEPLRVPRARPVDVGPGMGLPSAWCMPAPPVHFFRLVHVPMGHAGRLGELAVVAAAYKALHDLLTGPPVDFEGARFVAPRELRASLPGADAPQQVQQRIVEALGRVRFEGSRPLGDAIEAALRPVAAEVQGVLGIVEELERLRLQHLRAFTAAGVHYTAQALSARLDGVADPFPPERLSRLRGLLAGDGDGASGALIAWRNTFAGLSCQVAQRGTPGWSTARELVQERFALFRGEFAAAVARHLDGLLVRARDVDAAPSLGELRSLRDRAERVRDDLDELERRLRRRLEEECELAVREDRFVRWTAPEGQDLLRLLLARISELPVAAALQRRTTEILTRRPLGLSDDADFERYLQEISREAFSLVAQVDEVPSYEDVLLLLLQGRDPPVLRQALAASQGTEVELHLERPVEPALMNWFTATGMLVVVAPRLKTCAIYWQRLEDLTPEGSQAERGFLTEHRLGDLLLARPEGDSAADLARLARAAVYVQVGIVVGTLRLRRREGQLVELKAPRLGLRRRIYLPYDAIHAVAAQPDVLERLASQVEEALSALSLRADAVEMARKLNELAHMGLSPQVAAQLGVHGARLETVEHPMQALMRRCAQLAQATLTDCLHTSELSTSARAPRRRVIADILQLGPS